MRLTHNAQYVPHGFVDYQDQCGKFLPGDWRSMTHNDAGMVRLQGSINKYGKNAQEMRARFEKFVNSKEGSVQWETKCIQNCGETFAEAVYNKKDHLF